jgi:DNA-binding CsgD family transcriptional regulator
MAHVLPPRELTEIATSAAPLPQRAVALLGTMRRAFDFDGAWLALADHATNSYIALSSVDLDESTLEYLGGPTLARDINTTGTDRDQPPLSLSDLPYPGAELQTWAECLMPAGYREGLGTGLFTSDGRHVGNLGIFFGSKTPPPEQTRRRVARLRSVLAYGIDPMRSLRTAARMVQGATSGVVLRADRGTQALPGLDGDALLSRGSPLVDAARTALHGGSIFTSFLWPLGGRHAPEGHTRVTVFGSSDDVPKVLLGLVVLSPVADCRGLTPRELEVLGWLIEGLSNQEIAHALVVAQRTVAAHVEHILHKMDAPTRTLAAVRAQRAGLYVPVRDLPPVL